MGWCTLDAGSGAGRRLGTSLTHPSASRERFPGSMPRLFLLIHPVAFAAYILSTSYCAFLLDQPDCFLLQKHEIYCGLTSVRHENAHTGRLVVFFCYVPQDAPYTGAISTERVRVLHLSLDAVPRRLRPQYDDWSAILGHLSTPTFSYDSQSNRSPGAAGAAGQHRRDVGCVPTI